MLQGSLNNKWPGERNLIILNDELLKNAPNLLYHIKIHRKCGRRVSKCDQNKTNASFDYE